MHPATANNIRGAALDAASAILYTLNAHAPESVPAPVRAALHNALDAAWAAFDAVNAAVLDAARADMERHA